MKRTELLSTRLASDATSGGPTAIVTGAAQGIGWAIVQALADYGARVIGWDISASNIAEAEAQLETSPWRERISFQRCDVADREQVMALVEQASSASGPIDVLVNNAAFVRFKGVDELTIEEAEQTMRVGYSGMLYTTKAVLPGMRARGRGSIVNMGSSAGRLQIGRASTAYAATKAAIEAYTKELQCELEGSGVDAMLVRPGAVAGTEFFQRHVASSRMPRALDFLPALLPPQVARAVVRGIRQRRRVVDVPGYLAWLYPWFDIAPRLFAWLFKLGGDSRKDHGAAEWRYQPRAQNAGRVDVERIPSA